MNGNRKTDLISKSTAARARYLEDLKAQVDAMAEAGGAVPYPQALEAIQAAVRFAGEVGSVADLETLRTAA